METTAPTIMDTIAETLSETIPAETVAEVIETTAETIPQVIEVVETIDYMPVLVQIMENSGNMEYFLYLLTGIALFFTVVCLCYFCYKFFRIFF